MKALQQAQVVRFRRGWALRQTVIWAPITVLGAAAWYSKFSLMTAGAWVVTTVVVVVLCVGVLLWMNLGKCPECKASLDGLKVPVVCTNCRTLLQPDSAEGRETLLRLSRPAASLSPAELEEFSGDRRRRRWWVAGVVVSVAAAIIGFKYGGLEVPWFVSPTAVPISLAIARWISRSSKCPVCDVVIPLEEEPERCGLCGTVLSCKSGGIVAAGRTADN